MENGNHASTVKFARSGGAYSNDGGTADMAGETFLFLV